MFSKLVTVDTNVDAPAAAVWQALTKHTGEMFMGADVKTDWQTGHPITFQGEFKGKPYRDKGEVVTVEQNKRLEFTHFSESSGKKDAPENYNLITIDLEPQADDTTRVVFTQSADEAAKKPDAKTLDQFRNMYAGMLSTLKKIAEA